MEVTYKKASKRDVEELVRLRLAYLTADFGELTSEQTLHLRQTLPGYFENHLNNDLVALVAECDNKLVGTCWLLVVEKPASIAFMHGRTGAIFNVFVDRDYRKRGIARTLMYGLIEEARRLELDRLELRATAMGYNLYRSIGFKDDESTHRAMNYSLGE